jgi:hypothetical protein
MEFNQFAAWILFAELEKEDIKFYIRVCKIKIPYAAIDVGNGAKAYIDTR